MIVTLTIDQEMLLSHRIQELQDIIAAKNARIMELEADLASEKVAANHLAALVMNADMQLEDRE